MQNRFASEYYRPLQYRMLSLCYCYHKCHRYYGNGYTDNDIGGQWFSEHESADQYCRDRFEDSQNWCLRSADITCRNRQSRCRDYCRQDCQSDKIHPVCTGRNAGGDRCSGYDYLAEKYEYPHSQSIKCEKRIDCPASPCVISRTPPNVAAIASQTGQEGTTRRNTIMIATRTGYRNISVVARPDAI